MVGKIGGKSFQTSATIRIRKSTSSKLTYFPDRKLFRDFLSAFSSLLANLMLSVVRTAHVITIHLDLNVLISQFLLHNFLTFYKLFYFIVI